jgi:hypothetical protein
MVAGVKRLIASGLALLAVTAGEATAAEPGPPYSVPVERMAEALHCPEAFKPTRQPVLLVHGTAANGDLNWGWNYAAVLPELGFDPCTVDLPESSYGDIQPASEYVVYALREIATRSGQKVDVIGHSQGTLQPRWAIRWWPDVRAKLDDYVSLAGPHRGTTQADLACAKGSCPAAIWQMRPGSRFLNALNGGGETPGALSYTSLFSENDELATPYSNSPLDGASNILVQSLCPGRRVTHFGMVYDAVVYSMVMDALTHPGPADAARFAPATCGESAMPGADTTRALLFEALADPGAVGLTLAARQVDREPRLADYTRGAPGGAPILRIGLRVRPGSAIAGRRTRFRFRATARGALLEGARIRFAGRRMRTGKRGRAHLVTRLKAGTRRARASKRGFRPGTARVRIRRLR